jgi:DNA-binding transcriptional regulator YiaG
VKILCFLEVESYKSGGYIVNMKNLKKVSYDNFARTFSNSRKNLKWEEINYFFGFLE